MTNKKSSTSSFKGKAPVIPNKRVKASNSNHIKRIYPNQSPLPKPSNTLTSKPHTMATSSDAQLFDESFTITTLNHEKYERVGRIGGSSSNSETSMTLDINTELYPLSVGDHIQVVLASSLALDGSKDDGRGWRDVRGETTLADMFDYVCHGKVYKFEDVEDGQTM